MSGPSRKPDPAPLIRPGSVGVITAPVYEPLLYPSRYKAAYGGRGSGKSHMFAENLIDKALTTPRLRWACIREVQLTLDQSVKLLLEDKISKFRVTKYFNIQKSEIRTPGNGIIIFRGMQHYNADSIKSLEDFDGAWVEEAQNFSQTSLDLLRPTLRKPGSEMWFSWNPRSDKDAVDAFFRKKDPPPDSIIVNANWYDNPFFPEVLRKDKDYDQRRDPERYAHVWLGKYRKHSEARVFRNWVIEEFETPANARFLFGADWGFASDPSVLVRCFIIGRTLYVDHEAYKLHCPIDKLPALFNSVPGAKDGKIVADSARPETINYMVSNGGFNMVGAVKGKGSVYEGVEFLKSYDIVVHPRCVHTADELSFYSYKIDKKTDEVLDELEDDNNNVIDSLRYALESTRRGISMIDYL